MTHQTDVYLWGRITKVVDGDTVDMELPVYGEELILRRRMRLYGINAPEMKAPTTKEGKAAKQWLAEQVAKWKGGFFLHVLPKHEKYGRDLVILYLTETDQHGGFGNSLNQQMIALKLAVPYVP